MTTDFSLYRREFYREPDILKSFKDFEIDPDFAAKNITDFFGKIWLPTHPDALTLDDVLRPFYNDSQDESKGIFFRVFAVSDGSLVQHTEENDPWLSQGIRFVTLVAGNEQGGDAQPFQLGGWTLCIVGSRLVADQRAFLQVASWDGARFRFYGREHVNDPGQQETTPLKWILMGDSTEAFGSQSYMGPFNGHVNGSLVMKELRRPWIHWLVAGNGFGNRMSTALLAEFDKFPYLSDPVDDHTSEQKLFSSQLSKVSSADELESSILTGINSWFGVRRKTDFFDKNQPRAEVQNVKRWLAHVLLTTTINIVAATRNQSATQPGTNFDIPIAHFYNADVFGNTAAAAVKPTVSLSNSLTFNSNAYDVAFDKLGLGIVAPSPPPNRPQPDYNKHPKVGRVPTFGGSNDMFMIQPGEGADIFFVALQPSYEDSQGVGILLTLKTPLLSKDCLYALLMVDPYNPIYSWRRGVLMQYVPDTTRLSGPFDPKNPTARTYDLEAKIEAAVRASPRFVNEHDSPEREFIDNLEAQRNKTSKFSEEMNDYLSKVMERLRTDPQDALLDYMTLAESRRRIYRPVPLDEFAMTLPWASKYDYDRPFEMTKDGTITPVPDRGKNFFEQWIGSLASYDPQMIPKPDADGDDSIQNSSMGALFSLDEPAVLNIGCQATSIPQYRLGGGCPFMTIRQKQGQQ